MTNTLLKGFFQLGYVCPDLGAAIAGYGAHLGISDFWVFDTVASGRPNPIRVGLAWKGEVMIELIQPIGAPNDLYAHALKPSGPELHHLGYLVSDAEDWAAREAALGAAKTPIIRTGGAVTGLEIMYADARPLLGHHLEYVWLKPGAPDFFAQVPRN